MLEIALVWCMAFLALAGGSFMIVKACGNDALPLRIICGVCGPLTVALGGFVVFLILRPMF